MTHLRAVSVCRNTRARQRPCAPQLTPHLLAKEVEREGPKKHQHHLHIAFASRVRLELSRQRWIISLDGLRLAMLVTIRGMRVIFVEVIVHSDSWLLARCACMGFVCSGLQGERVHAAVPLNDDKWLSACFQMDVLVKVEKGVVVAVFSRLQQIVSKWLILRDSLQLCCTEFRSTIFLDFFKVFFSFFFFSFMTT